MNTLHKVALTGFAVAGAAGFVSQGAESIGCDGQVETVGENYNPHCEGEIVGLALDVHNVTKVLAIGAGLTSLVVIIPAERREPYLTAKSV